VGKHLPSFTFEAIGTHWQIDVLDDISQTDAQSLLSKIHKRIDDFDRDYSRFRTDSLITKMSLQGGAYTLPTDAEPLFDLYRDLYNLTGGAFTPLIGQVLSDAGYDAEYSLQLKKELQKPESWEKVIEYQFPELFLKKPALLDFGAAGKGYLIDLVGELLQEQGIHSFCLDAGGDILYRSEQKSPLRIGLEHPENTQQVIGVTYLTNKSICASAGNRRKWEQFHHIVNPHTLRSPEHILATWVIAETTMLADALATCLFFVPGKMLVKHYNFEYITLNAEYSVEKSAEFPAELFYE
jgi:FAD:protein FMN transferase